MQLSLLFLFFSFRKCFVCRSFHPVDCAIASCVKPQQAAIKFRDRTRVDVVVQGLPLTTLTGLRCGDTRFVQVSTTWPVINSHHERHGRLDGTRLPHSRTTYRDIYWPYLLCNPAVLQPVFDHSSPLLNGFHTNGCTDSASVIGSVWIIVVCLHTVCYSI